MPGQTTMTTTTRTTRSHAKCNCLLHKDVARRFVRLSSYSPPPLCIVFSAERRIRLSFSYRFGHVSSCCCRCLINLKLYECCRLANVASILLQFTQLPPPVYRPLSLAPKPKRAESVSTKRENFPKAKNETERVEHEKWPGLPTKLFFIEPNLVVRHAQQQQQQHTLHLTSCQFHCQSQSKSQLQLPLQSQFESRKNYAYFAYV